MLDREKILHDQRILDLIWSLNANAASGALQITAGATEGALLFNNGLLVGAQFGHLTGFQAINAVVAMPDAHVKFDSSVVPPAVSSIKPSERVVLKQFFRIETLDARDHHEAAVAAVPEVEPVRPSIDQPLLAREEEVTLVRSEAPPTAVPRTAPLFASPPEFPYRRALLFAVLLIAVTVAAVMLYRLRETTAPVSVASDVETAARPAATAQAPLVDEPRAEIKSASPAVAVKSKEAPSLPAAQVKKDDAVTHVAQNLSGKWNVVNTVESTSYNSYKNLKIGFNLSIDQNGKEFTGRGLKVSENGRVLPADSRTPIQLKGSIQGDQVEATFFEEGTVRKTNGRFVWRIDKAGRLRGTFVSTAARARGKSAAHREL